MKALFLKASMNLGRYFVSGAGSSTATVVFGGDASPPMTGATEEFNGSGWATSNALNQARQSPGGMRELKQQH